MTTAIPMPSRPIYLDHNATTPVDPRVVAAMLPYLTEHFGNPSSTHPFGAEPRAAVATARVQVADLIGAQADEIVFTATGSEADATAIRGVVTAARRAGVERPHVITQATEHPAVLAACSYAARHHGAVVTVLDVDIDGLVHPDQVRRAMTDDTVLVSVMQANNETGVLQPIAELAATAHERGALFHTDAAQSVGKIAVDVGVLGVDLLTLVGHKMYAPKGIAALYVRTGVDVEALVGGGGQERGRRGGTENVPSIVGLGAAARIAADELAAGSPERLAILRDQLLDLIRGYAPGRVHVNGAGAPRLPQTLNISIDGTQGHAVLDQCPGVAASTGSACHSGQHSPSPVLTAMGLTPERAMAALRLTLGRWTDGQQITAAADELGRAVR
ncbi:MAG TPA: cysteine desulfurase family protein [Cellulomonas sp.]|uniref:cysteine desulfurase family protein n=1 Tax=Cellulomonas sp. TaxID=40001 RepID=UPI002E3386CC|nr:cysteine desulfurase family protein [Cellulomonas sp.]HEX5332280.1 cysteine desulfurase family protein [Cellulomonas sp.]